MLTAPDAPPLLAAPAMKYVGDHLIEIRERLDTAVAEEINRAATQADLLVVLDYLAHSAVDSHVALPLSLVDVRKWLRMTGA
jgi:hypothetical protein